MSSDAAREQVSQIRFVNSLSPALADKVADLIIEISNQESVPIGTTLFTRGDPSTDSGIILLEGEVSVEKEDFPEIIAVAPELLGEMAQLNPTKQRTATVTATTDLNMLRFSWKVFTDKLRRSFSEAEVEQVSSALQEFAWQHFTQ